MALQTFPNQFGSLICTYPSQPHFSPSISPSNSTLNAAGESAAIIGYVTLEGGSSGGSKTISSSGGKIHWRSSTLTFSNAGTTIRVGINDVGVTGLEDGTHDVYKDLVGGTDTINNGLNSTAMASGSKTISHGDFIAVVIEMTARGGTDQITVPVYGPFLIPYGTVDTGAGPTKSSNCMQVTIEFDDGTVGWIGNNFIIPGGTATGLGTNTTFNVSSNPDERALIFQLPFPCSIVAPYLYLSSIASTDDYEIILYSDPLGTPVAKRTITVDADLEGSASGPNIKGFSTPYSISANTKYALAVRPTTANSVGWSDWVYGGGNSHLLRPSVLGANWYLGTRTNQTGAFTETTTTLPIAGFFINQFDDGVSTGGFTGIIGGV